MITEKQKRSGRHWVLVLPPVFALLAVLFHEPLVSLANILGRLYACPLHTFTGILCPGCGGTRSMLALLRGHFSEALHDNPAAPGLVLILLLLYLEAIFAAFGKPVKLFPRSVVFWGIILGVHLIWAVVRNFVPAMQPY